MNEKINLQDLSARLAERAEISKREAETFLREYFEVMNEELIKSDLLKIRDLGTFKLLPVEDRQSIDVTTGERFLIPAHHKVTFTPDKKLAETVNEPFAIFETIEIGDDITVEELKLLSEESPSKESEPAFEEKEETVSEEEPVFDIETRDCCFNSHDHQVHDEYRKKYYIVQKRLKRLKIIVFILCFLLVLLLGYAIWISMPENFFKIF